MNAVEIKHLYCEMSGTMTVLFPVNRRFWSGSLLSLSDDGDVAREVDIDGLFRVMHIADRYVDDRKEEEGVNEDYRYDLIPRPGTEP